MPRLQVLNGKRQGATVEIGRGEIVVGHRNTAPVCIDDPWVSWDHARLFFQNDGFWIEDLGSTNGTYVNCVRVKRERLNHEDIVFFGKTHVIFLVPELGRTPSASGGSREGQRSDFELGVAQLATAAEQWTQPSSPQRPRRGVLNASASGAPGASAAPAIPVPPEELTDPLGMAGVARGLEDPGRAPDPFRSGDDPWLAGPPPRADVDPFASARSEAATDPFLGGQQRIRAFADTHLDAEALPENAPAARGGRSGPGLEDFGIDDQDPADGPALAPASAAEVSSLLDRKDSDGPLDDLDALLGDNAARTPDPGVYRAPPGTGVRRKSEALTRPIDTLNAARAVESSEAAIRAGAAPGREPGSDPSGRAPAQRGSLPPLPPPPMPAPLLGPTGRFRPPPSRRRTPAPRCSPRREWPSGPHPPAASKPDPDESRPIPVGELAFEVAKLQDEVRRLRAALDATRASDPEKVRVAVEALRDQELGRQAREIAELRRELAESCQELEQKQSELDDVTGDMIAKEDTIDALEKKVRALEARAGNAGGTPTARTNALAGSDDLSF